MICKCMGEADPSIQLHGAKVIFIKSYMLFSLFSLSLLPSGTCSLLLRFLQEVSGREVIIQSSIFSSTIIPKNWFGKKLTILYIAGDFVP